MSPKLEKLITEALQLPREARAFIAEKLLESLDFDEAFEVSPEWKDEIRRRCQELDEGRVSLGTCQGIELLPRQGETHGNNLGLLAQEVGEGANGHH
jgi:putative addiction module component (TIGR02574 family)